MLLIWAAFQVWANMFGTLGAVKLRTAHIMFLLPLAFTLYPTFKKERRRRRLMPVWDIALTAAAILSYGYLFLRYDAVARTGRLNATDVWVGVVCLLGLAGQLHWYRLFPPVTAGRSRLERTGLR